jgi:hypothetical protein
MIEKLKESRGSAFGFKVTETLTTGDIVAISQQIDNAITGLKKPIGVLADLSAMHGASWATRWEEMRFLQRHTDHIALLAIVSDEKWEAITETILVAAAALQAETRYFNSSEILHAWHWVRTATHDEGIPIRVMYPGKGLFQNYTPEYMET